MAPKRTRRIFCSASGCTNNSSNSAVTFFKFPKEDDRSLIWQKNCGRPDLGVFTTRHLYNNYKLCSDHFPKRAMSRYERHLKRGAVPNSVDKSADPDGVRETETILITPAEELSTKRSSSEDPLPVEGTIAHRQILDYVRTNYNERFATVFETCFYLQQHNMNCEELSEHSPALVFSQVYEIMCNFFYVTTLRDLSINWCTPPEFNDITLSLIEFRVNSMTEIERHCVLYVDWASMRATMFCTKNKYPTKTSSDMRQICARNVIVIAAKGLFADWEQALDYFFVDSPTPVEMSTLIEETILRLDDINVKVHAVASNRSSFMILFMEHHRICPEKPYFLVNERKIFYFVDVPTLLQETKTSLFKYMFLLPDGVVEKVYIEKFYNADKTLRCRLAPKLTRSHMGTRNYGRGDVIMSAQVLSGSVSAALMAYIGLGGLPSQAYPTANFVDEMDRLFDVFNSVKCVTKKEFQKPFTGSEKQIHFLKGMYEKFSKMRIMYGNKDVTQITTFLDGWKLSIMSLIGLYESTKHVCSEIYTRRLNLDTLDGFFQILRANKSQPTLNGVNKSFKTFFCQTYFGWSSKASPDEDFGKMLECVKGQIEQRSRF